jgi:hypothetical protein
MDQTPKTVPVTTFDVNSHQDAMCSDLTRMDCRMLRLHGFD